MKSKLLFLLFALSVSFSGFSTVWTVNNSGTTFSPNLITITAGDSVNFSISSNHDANEVSQTTWNANGNTHLAGGFQTAFGGGMVLPALLGVGTHYYVCTPHAGVGMKGRIIVQACTAPAMPGAISGLTTICSSSSNTYSVAAVSGATSYTWTLPGGWTGTSTNTSINTSASSTSGTISVVANNGCGISSPRTLAVTVNTAPAQPAAISGTQTICASTSNTYSVTAVSGATSYTWSLPSGWSGTSTSNSITATSSANSGNITVSATNSCGTSAAQSQSITVNSAPAAPAIINGPPTVCLGDNAAFSINPVSGATSYNWSASSSGNTGTGLSFSFTALIPDVISVTAANSCGTSAATSTNLNINKIPLVSPITGNTTICPGATVTYTANPFPGAVYNWTLPLGWSGTSTSNQITVTAGPTGGTLTVDGTNFCGTSPQATLSISVTAPIIAPASIVGSTSICANGTTLYSVNPVSGATSYNWTLPNGWTGTSNTSSISATANGSGGTISVSASDACSTTSAATQTVSINPIPAQPQSITGNNAVCAGSSQTYSIASVADATSYQWTMPSGWSGASGSEIINLLAGTSGDITVAAVNSCGTSAVQTITVVANNGIPATPGTISGNSPVCEASLNTYSINQVPEAASYIWTLPNGWSGTSTDSSIATIAGAAGGTIDVAATNACGTSSSQTLTVAVSGGSALPQPGIISGTVNVCESTSNIYFIDPVAGATFYTWTLPNGWTGTSTTDSITAIAGALSGDITVSANNFCGSSAPQSLSVNAMTVPAAPGVISGNSTICPFSSNFYSIAAVAGVTSYTWSLPNGWTGTSTVNSITGAADNTGGNITVTADNTCGSSPAETLSVTVTVVNTAVTQAGNILTAIAADSFQWLDCSNNTALSGETNQTFTASINGDYSVLITSNGCSDTSSCYNVSTVGLAENNTTAEISVYPNPSNGLFQLELQGWLLSKNSTLEIVNMQGKRVFQSEIAASISMIDLSNYSKGMYFIRISDDKTSRTKKVVVE